MDYLNPPASFDKKYFNTVSPIGCTRMFNITNSIFNRWINANEYNITIDRVSFIDTILVSTIEKYTTVYFSKDFYGTANNWVIKIAPALLRNLKKFLKGRYIKSHYRLLDLYEPSKIALEDSDIHLITQCTFYNDNGKNVCIISGYAICHYNEILYSYNMNPLNNKALVEINKTHYLINNKDVWWLPNWIVKDTITPEQRKTVVGIDKYPKFLRQLIKTENKKVIDNRVSVTSTPIQSNLTKKENEMIMQKPNPPAFNIQQLLSKPDIYRKLIASLGANKTVYYENNEVVDIAYSTTLKNKQIIVVFLAGSDNPVVIEDINKFYVVEKVKLF